MNTYYIIKRQQELMSDLMELQFEILGEVLDGDETKAELYKRIDALEEANKKAVAKTKNQMLEIKRLEDTLNEKVKK